MTRKYFGTDGIRGRANGVITPELALKVGQAAGLTFQNGEHRHRVLIGKDTRLSGYMIENALTAPVGLPSNSSISFTANRSRRRTSRSMKDGFGVSTANPSGTSVMFWETSRFSVWSLKR